jgi:hypothetical protein
LTDISFNSSAVKKSKEGRGKEMAIIRRNKIGEKGMLGERDAFMTIYIINKEIFR